MEIPLPSDIASPKVFPEAEARPLHPLYVALSIHTEFGESKMTKDRCLKGPRFLPSLRLFFGLNSAVKLGRQDIMTATADSRFVQSAVEHLTPVFLFVSTALRMSNQIVMNAQQKTPARPTFTGVRIWRSLSIASGNAMTKVDLAFGTICQDPDMNSRGLRRR